MLNGRAYIAFTNNGNNALHLGWFNGSSQLQGSEIIRLGGVVHTAGTGPALAADPANNILYLAWAGTDRTHRLNFTQSFDGGRTWPAGPVTTAETVAWAPTLAVRDSQVYVGWTGTDPDNTPNVAKYALGRELDTASLPFGGVLRVGDRRPAAPGSPPMARRCTPRSPPTPSSAGCSATTPRPTRRTEYRPYGGSRHPVPTRRRT